MHRLLSELSTITSRNQARQAYLTHSIGKVSLCTDKNNIVTQVNAEQQSMSLECIFPSCLQSLASCNVIRGLESHKLQIKFCFGKSSQLTSGLMHDCWEDAVLY
jgi:hypothetical protein